MNKPIDLRIAYRGAHDGYWQNPRENEIGWRINMALDRLQDEENTCGVLGGERSAATRLKTLDLVSKPVWERKNGGKDGTQKQNA